MAAAVRAKTGKPMALGLVANSEGKYGRAEDLHDMLKIALGYTRRIKMLVPSVWENLRSTSRD
jgi:hypothetical protein